jgi:hypothetical protein
MKFYFTTILIIFSSCVFSQKLRTPEKLTQNQFMLRSPKYPLILQNNNLITFPYHYNNNITGALDKYFTIEIESHLRLLIKKSDSCQLFVLPASFENGVKIKTVKYHYLNENKITERKVIETEISQTTTDKGSFLDFSKIISDSTAIIDIFLKSESNNKQKISLILDKDKTYKSYSIQIYIPKIYIYKENYDSCLSTKIEKDLEGPRIGYVGGSDVLICEVLAKSFSRYNGGKYTPVYCKIDHLSYTSNAQCPETFDSIKELVNFTLVKINEMTTANAW